MSSRKAAVIGISSLLGSMQAVEQTYGIFPAIPYRISKVRDNLPKARVLPQSPRNPFNLSHHFFFCKCSPHFPSQASLNMLTLCIAEELKKEEILFSVLHPGWVRTDMGGAEVTKHFFFFNQPHLTRHTQKETNQQRQQGRNLNDNHSFIAQEAISRSHSCSLCRYFLTENDTYFKGNSANRFCAKANSYTQSHTQYNH